MAHTLSPAQLAKLEADRLALLAAHASLPALKAAAAAAHDAVAAVEANVAKLLADIAHGAFEGIEVVDAPPKMSAQKDAGQSEGPKSLAIAAAKALGLSKLSKKSG